MTEEIELTDFQQDLRKEIKGIHSKLTRLNSRVSTIVRREEAAYDSMKCNDCGIRYFLSPKYIDNRRDDHRNFYCPNGHPNWYPGESSEDKLRKELEETEKNYAQCKNDMESDITSRDIEILELKRSRAAYKGMLTKEGVDIKE